MPTGSHVGNNYTPAEREKALTALALEGGNLTRAIALMKQDSSFKRVPARQALSKWMRDYQGQYNEIVTQVAPQIRKRIEHDYEQLVVRSNEVQMDAVELASYGLKLDESMTPEERAQRLQEARDASQTAKNIAISGGVSATHLNLIRGEPTSITEHRDPDSLLREIERIAGKRESIDSTAEEITGASELASPSDG